MLNDLQRRKLIHLFHSYDTDDNGFVEVEDFERVVHSLAGARGWKVDGPEYTRLRHGFLEQWQVLGVAADPPGSGRIKPDAWLALWGAILVSSYDDRLRRITGLLFDSMDADEDGSISLDESRAWFEAFGHPSEADFVFPLCDLNGDGRISSDEWAVLVHDFFFSGDPDARGNIVFGRMSRSG